MRVVSILMPVRNEAGILDVYHPEEALPQMPHIVLGTRFTLLLRKPCFYPPFPSLR